MQQALRKLYGIGDWQAQVVCARLGLNPGTRLEQYRHMMPLVSTFLDANYRSKAQIQREIGDNINLKIKMHSFEGQRHQYCLAVNGQRNSNMKTQQRLGMLRAKALNFPLARPSKKGRK